MSAVYDIIKELENTNSSNEKLAIMQHNKDFCTLKRCFELAYSPTVNFFMKQLPEARDVGANYNTSLSEGLDEILNLSNRVITGNAAKDFYKELLHTLSFEDQIILNRIVKGDMKCGVGKTICNKVWKGLIVVPPRQGAASMNEKSLKKLHSIKNLAIELKSDGSYAASVCGENTTMMSRNGNPLDIEPLQKHLSCGAFNGYALEGELVYDLEKATREEGNGKVTKIVKGTASEEDKDNVFLQVWDCISTEYYRPKGKWEVDNTTRRGCLQNLVGLYNMWCREHDIKSKIVLIDRHENVSVEEAMEIFEGYVRDGMEGAIAKDMDAGWSDTGKPAYCIKIKRKEPADLKVVSTYEGKEGSKYVGMLGGLYCESECGRIKVSVGSGFSDEERQEFLENPPKIIETEYDSITKDKKTLQESLFLPIYKRPRYDKDVGDTYEQILDKVKIK